MNGWLWLAVGVFWLTIGFLLSLVLGRVIRHASDQYPPVTKGPPHVREDRRDGPQTNGG